MKLDSLQQRLIAAARAQPPGVGVPYAFEQRIMAHIRARHLPDAWASWSQALWRAAAPCVALAVVLLVWSAVSPVATGDTHTLTDDLESAVMAGIPHLDDVW